MDNEELEKMYNLSLDSRIPKVDVVVIAVKHKKYCNMKIDELEKLFRDKSKIIFDLYAIFDKEKLLERGFDIWRL